MRIIKILGVFLILVLALLLIIAAFVPKEYKVQRSIVIDAKPCAVFPQIQFFENVVKWDPWSRKDSSIVQTFNGSPGQAGSSYAWKGNSDVGSGMMERETLTRNKEVNNIVTLYAPQKLVSNGNMVLNEVDNGARTEITWTMSGTTSYPKNVTNLLIDGYLGPSFENGLMNLKVLVESSKVEPVNQFELKGSKYWGLKKSLNWSEMATFFEEAYGKTFSYMNQECFTFAGPSASLIYAWDTVNRRARCAAVYPYEIAEDTNQIKQVLYFGADSMMIYNHKLVYSRVGPFETTKVAHDALDAMLLKMNKRHTFPILESYVKGPDEIDDPSKYITEVTYYIR